MDTWNPNSESAKLAKYELTDSDKKKLDKHSKV